MSLQEVEECAEGVDDWSLQFGESDGGAHVELSLAHHERTARGPGAVRARETVHHDVVAVPERLVDERVTTLLEEAHNTRVRTVLEKGKSAVYDTE